MECPLSKPPRAGGGRTAPRRGLIRLREELEKHYHFHNRRESVGVDPILFIYPFKDIAERETAAMIASALAYGRVRQINQSLRRVFDCLGGSPYQFLRAARTCEEIRERLSGFKHRFADEEDMASFLWGIRGLYERYGSLEAAFLPGIGPKDETVYPALVRFAEELRAGMTETTEGARAAANHLLPDPGKGGACKRLNLFLRWMVREDAIDPGGWEKVSPSLLIMPLDTHIHRISRELGLTARRAADMKTALEITSAFRAISPSDPVRYDYALTRLGIRGGTRLAPLAALKGGISP